MLVKDGEASRRAARISGEGFEFHLLAIALAIPLAVKGAGSYALDGVFERVLRMAHAHRVLAATGPTR
jgi:uncharacterized membrane protein YphA (DoxX/SURF4 family)